MNDSIARHLAGITDPVAREAIRKIVNALADRYSTQALTSAGLVVKTATTGVLVKTGSADFYASVQGKLVKIAAATDMPALTGTITANKYNVYCFFVDGAGTVTLGKGVEAATIAAVQWPPFPENKALIGFVLITHSSTFTGNTTALDTATTVYVSPTGPFDPSVIL